MTLYFTLIILLNSFILIYFSTFIFMPFCIRDLTQRGAKFLIFSTPQKIRLLCVFTIFQIYKWLLLEFNVRIYRSEIPDAAFLFSEQAISKFQIF